MAYPGFSKLQSEDRDMVEDDVPPATLPKMTGRRPRSFTRFELGLIITLVLFAAALAVYTVVYIVQHQGAIRPAAVAALSCVALLLLVVAYSIYKRIRRPNWFRDVESGQKGGDIKKWNISAPIPISIPSQVNNMPNMSELTLVSEPTTTTTYTTISSETISSKGRLQKKDRPVEKERRHRLAFWLSSSSKRRADKAYYEHLISSARSSSEISEGGYHHQPEDTSNQRPRSLWRSVFELPGEDPFNTTRPTTPELPAGDDVQIVVTRPEPTARQSLHRARSQSSGSLDVAAIRQAMTLTVDPLRSNPFVLQQLRRDPSVRQTKSSHALGAVPISVTPPPASAPFAASPRRPRSAEPGPDRARLGYDLATVQLQIDRAVAEMEVNSRRVAHVQKQREPPRIIQTRPSPPQPLPSPPRQPRSEARSRSTSRPGTDQGHERQRPHQQSPNARGLRRAKSPVVDIESSGQDLRKVYQSQLGK